MKVIYVDISKGETHDFNLFKKNKLRFLESIKLFVDSGYQGICNYHSNSEIPIKFSKIINHLTKIKNTIIIFLKSVSILNILIAI